MKRPGGLAVLVVGGFLILMGVLPSGTAVAADRPTVDPRAPEAPLPGYTPRFVTQTDEPAPWDDCLWASGAMLLDKWTRGDARADRHRLRRASGDMSAGSHFTDLVGGVSELYGWRPRWSPSGGDPMTWEDLLQRLAEGGGAVVAGDYGNLGNPYIRWDRDYALKPGAAGHAMYVERYDAEHDRLWLMDPLGRSGYAGEWVPAARVRDFVWKSGRLVHAMATPAPPAVSTAGYVPAPLALGDGSAHRAGEAMIVGLSFVEEGRWPLPELQLATRWELVEPDGWARPVVEPGADASADTRVARVTAPLAVPEPAPTDDMAHLAPVVTPTMAALASDVALPAKPGLWRLFAAIERRDGRPVPKDWQQLPLDMRVWGNRGAVVLPAPPSGEVVAATAVTLTVAVENAGLLDWPYEGLDPRLGEAQPSAAAELHVSWMRANGTETLAAPPLTLTARSGEQLSIELALAAPRLPGTYQLHFDVRDGHGSLLAPATLAELTIEVARVPLPEQVPVTNQ